MPDPAPTPTASTALPAEDPRDRRRVITSNVAMFGAGAAVCALVFLLVGDILAHGHLASRIASDAALLLLLLLLLLSYITLSTRSAVRQLVETLVALVRTAITDTIRREVREQLKEPGDKIAAELSTIRERLDGPTVPLKREVLPSPRPVVYAGIAPVITGDGRGIEARLAAIEERVGEYGGQQFFKGYAAATEDQAGAVVPITRNGQRSTS